MLDVTKTLSKIGLSQNEIKVYLTLNDNGSMKAGRLSKLAHLDRSSAYNAIQMLLDKGFVSYVFVGKVKWFQAVGPKRILDYLKPPLVMNSALNLLCRTNLTKNDLHRYSCS